LTGNRATATYYSVIGEAVGDAKADLLQGTLDLIVLRLLRGGPANGWDITQSIQVVSKGALEINYGSVYPALRRLEARGFVKAEWGVSDNNRRARFYELTTSGRKQLAAEREAWERFAAALGLILDGA
jgi:PadR family transcriptional regulator, regulatory protein PadR